MDRAELRRHFALDVDDDGLAAARSARRTPRETGRSRHHGRARRTTTTTCARCGRGGGLRRRWRSSLRARRRRTSSATSATSTVDESLCGGCASCVKTCAFGACSIDADDRRLARRPAPLPRLRQVRRLVPGGRARPRVVAARATCSRRSARSRRRPLTAPRVLGFLCGGLRLPGRRRARTARGRRRRDATPRRSCRCASRAAAASTRCTCSRRSRRGFDGVASSAAARATATTSSATSTWTGASTCCAPCCARGGIDDARLRIIDISPEEGALFAEEVNAFFDDLAPLAPAEGRSAMKPTLATVVLGGCTGCHVSLLDAARGARRPARRGRPRPLAAHGRRRDARSATSSWWRARSAPTLDEADAARRAREGRRRSWPSARARRWAASAGCATCSTLGRSCASAYGDGGGPLQAGRGRRRPSRRCASRVRRVSDVVDVDIEVPGCAPLPEMLLARSPRPSRASRYERAAPQPVRECDRARTSRCSSTPAASSRTPCTRVMELDDDRPRALPARAGRHLHGAR